MQNLGHPTTFLGLNIVRDDTSFPGLTLRNPVSNTQSHCRVFSAGKLNDARECCDTCSTGQINYGIECY
jgi:hypothetical protein